MKVQGMSSWVMPGIIRTDSPDEVFKEACKMYKVSEEDMQAKAKVKETPYVEVRQVAMAVMRMLLPHPTRKDKDYPYWACGYYFKRDHATAFHAAKVVASYWEVDKKFKHKLQAHFGITESHISKINGQDT